MTSVIEMNDLIEVIQEQRSDKKQSIGNKEIVPGGCLIGNNDPKWECNDCLHRWGTRDEDGDE